MTDSLHLKLDPPVARLVLDRPGKLNAITEAMWTAVPGLVDQVESDRRIKLALVSGANSDAFAAGADISEFVRIAASRDAAATYGRHVAEAMRRLAGLSKPTIAVVQGQCIGGGCGLALCCDFRFADISAQFGITPARLGIAYSLEDTKRLVEIVGAVRAKDMLMTGRLIGADEALAIGLIDHLLPAETLWAEVERYAGTIAGNSQFSIRASKAAIAEILDGAVQETDRSGRLFADGFMGEDLAEGAAAFREKRRPRFTFS